MQTERLIDQDVFALIAETQGDDEALDRLIAAIGMGIDGTTMELADALAQRMRAAAELADEEALQGKSLTEGVLVTRYQVACERVNALRSDLDTWKLKDMEARALKSRRA